MRKVLASFLAIILTACASESGSPEADLPSPTLTILSATPPPTQNPRPTPTKHTIQTIHPYTIEGLREHDFTYGPISIRETLFEDEHFTRYKIYYPSDEIIISGILQIPTAGDPPYPVIVMNHGFFSRHVYQPGDGTDRAAQFLNRRGYLTVSSNYRSWGDSDAAESLLYSGLLYSSVSGDFSDMVERWGPGCVGDVFLGESTFGCNSSDILPLSLPADIIASYFDVSGDPLMLQSVSPLYHLENVTTPVQIVYGQEDGKVSSGTPPEWSKKIHQAFVDAGRESELFGYVGENHSFIGEPWFEFMARTQIFFDRMVKP